MLKNVFKRFLSLTLAIIMVISMLPATALTAFAASGSLTMDNEGLIVSYSGSGTVSGGGTSLNAEVDGKKGDGCTISDSAQTATVNFTNSLASGKAAYLSFDYSIAANNGSVKIGNDTLTGSGSYSVLIEGSLATSLVLKSGTGTGKKTTIALTNIALNEVSNVDVTFRAPENGSYTVDGEAITADTVKTIEPPVKYSVAATANAGYKLLGWYSTATDSYLSVADTADITVSEATTIYPEFVSSTTPVFKVGNQVYTDLNAANAAAKQSGSMIVLTQSGTLPAGNYEISSGVKLLIPYNSGETADFDEAPGLVNARKEGVYAKPTVYRSLTLASGATINCYGQINVNAQMYVETNIYTSQVTGPYGAIDLTSGSTLSLENGSTLYCYGYIGGSGTVEGKSGSNIYQMMQINDWRGGSATSDLSDKMKGNSFLFSQYYLQNVEANLKANYGSTMYAVTGLTAGSGILNQAKQVAAPIIGSDKGLFRLQSPGDYMTLKYNASTDRMELDLHGSVDTVGIEMSVDLGIGMKFSLNTDEYILPIPANFTINIHNGSKVSFTEKFKLLPGTEINVENGASVTVGTNGAVYLYDVDDWNSGKYSHQKNIYPLRYVHATKGAPAVVRKPDRDAILKVDGTLNAQGPIYSTKYTENGGDAGITGSGTIQIGAHGTTSLKEVNNNSTDAIVTVTCVPALGALAGHEGYSSFDLGTYKKANEKWYQYTLTGEGYTVVSGGMQDGTTTYIANAKDAPVQIIVQAQKECLKVSNAMMMLTDSVGRSVGDYYVLSDFSGNAVVTAKDTHTEVELEAKLPTCTETGLSEGIQCSECAVILKAQEEIAKLPHDYEAHVVDPTCTEQGFTYYVCKDCDDQSKDRDNYVDALGHTIAEGDLGQVTKPATCTEPGERTFNCAVCGKVAKTEVIEATGHIYGEWEITTEAGCETDGEKQKTCSCGDVVKETIPALGHSLDAGVVEIPATCAEMGTTKYTCTRGCGHTVSEKDIPATGNHDYQLTETTTAPTCTEAGNGVYTCSVCQSTENRVLDATGHTAAVDEAKAPTCTETGLTEGSHCSVCSAVITPQTIVDVLGHSYESVVTDPTCTEQGYTTHTCIRGDHSYVDSYIDKVGDAHQFTSEVVAPTCTNQGYTKNVCGLCKYEEKIAGTEVDALGHKHEAVVTAPTCTEQGYTTYTCSACADSYVADYVKATGHSYEDVVTAPTCTEEGFTTHTCTVCQYEVKDTYVEKLPHTPEDIITNATCTEEGKVEHICTECKEKTAEDTPIAALGHSHTVEVSVEKAATCTEPGSKTMQCERCEDQISVTILVLGHAYEDTITQQPTCTVHGNKSYVCSRCGDSGSETLMPLGHALQQTDPGKPATCTEAGYTEIFTCERCGETTGGEVIDALGHDFDVANGVEIVPATCYLEGQIMATCRVCFEENAVATAKIAHTPQIIPAVPATCTEDGSTEGAVCSVKGCRKNLITPEVIPATGHTYEADPGKEPTCTEPGQASGQKCADCGAWNGEIVEIPAKGHTCDDATWVSVKLPSCTEEGEETNTCTECGETVTRVVEMTAHVEEVIPAVATRYDKTGLTEGKQCTVCKTITVEQEEIPKLVLTWDTFLEGLQALEYYAGVYAKNNPGKDATKLMINYLRTGVDRYTDDSWETMAGAEETSFIKDVLAYDDIYGTHAYALREMDGLKIKTPNGQQMVFDHVFGALNVSSKNNYGVNNSDFGSWVGDLCDLMELTVGREGEGFSEDNYTVESLRELVAGKYFGTNAMLEESGFNWDDVAADLDAFYIVSRITAGETSLYQIFSEYYDAGLNDAERAAYFLNNRFPGSMTQEAVRASVYETYANNFLVGVLESSRELSTYVKLREACAYVFADYLFEQADGKLVAPETPDEGEEEEKPIKIYEVFESKASTLAPGVTQTANRATNGAGNQIIFYTATADIRRDDVSIYANYANNDPSKGWAMASVSSQMNAADANHADDPNYTPIAGVNASFYNMSTGEPSGLLVMNGVTYKGGGNTFFGVLQDGTPIIGGKEEYNIYKDQLVEAVEGGVILVKDGVSLYPEMNFKEDAPRTAVGITADGKVVLMVLDGRQYPYSSGGSYNLIAEIMINAGCVVAMNLDGGGSTTYVAKQEGADSISLVNKPSDTVERSVSSSLMIVSTAPTSKEFDRAVVNTPTDYITVGSSFDVELIGVGAAGNMADIPEGAVLQVSDSTKGSLEGNTFTALAVGKVEIQLMLNGKVVGTKTVTVIRRPTALSFGEANINAIYGIAKELPLVATYNNANATIRPEDIAFTMSNAAAGIMDGFAFIGTEASGVRNVTITAKLAEDETISASMGLRLYGADESVFDFDNVDAGNTSLAWNRNLINSTTIDRVNYYTVDPEKDVYADYIFAIDMKAIVAPVRLQPLMEYLNGFAEGVGDNASPWDYLLALGGRVSGLTTITIKATFPEGVIVDMSDVSFVNNYLTIRGTTFDEATRTMTIDCQWNRQTAGIDPSTANSIAILSGVKLIPEAYTGSLNVDVTGNVTYDIFLDTSQLHSFAKDPANQQKYGIYDYVNPADPDDAGGHFADTYINFEDHFVLHDGALNGWVATGADKDLHYYYVDNEKVTGIYCAEDMEGSDKSYYYDFGEDGRLVGKYTGLFLDSSANAYRYAELGVLKSGWVMIGDNWHYFSPSNKNAYTGRQKVGGVYFNFLEDGQVDGGAWAKDMGGTRYYYGPSYHLKGWYVIDGMGYGFDKGYMLTGIASIRVDKTKPYQYFDFGPAGKGPDGNGAQLLEGIHTIDGTLRYLENGILTEMGLFKHTDGYYYMSGYQGILRTNGEYGTYSVHGCDIPNGKYYFDSDGKMLVNDIVERDGKLYYFENGKPKEKGLFKFRDNYYYITYGGVVQTNGEFNTYVIGECDMPKGKYLFDAEGKMVVNDIVERDGKLYYYENGKPAEKGLFQFNGDYYLSVYGGLLKTDGIYGTYKIGECDLPNGRYEFGSDGKMLQGIVEKDGKLFYYENGKAVEKGLFQYNGDYYFSVYNGQLKVNGVYGTYKLGECDLPNGQYEFGPDGKMTKGIVEKDGKLYYYENGRGVEKGLFQYNGGYYFSGYMGELRVNGIYGVYILEDCGLPKGNYEFGPDGKMYDGIVEKDGRLYYYENGKGVEKGLFQYNGDYYFAGYMGVIRINGEYSVYKTSCDLPKGNYTFDAEGKMVQGIVERDGKLYYYENGKATEKGLFLYQGDYYFSIYKGELKTNGVYQTYQVKPCGIPNGKYEFGPDGKLLQGVVEKDGELYFYENGAGAEKGLFYYNGHYYFSVYKGKLVVDRNFYVYQGNGLLIEKTYTFNKLGQIVS